MDTKYLYIGLGVITLSMFTFGLTLETDAEESIEQLVVRVAEDYTKEQNFNGQCSINGTAVTLAQFIYGIGIAEGGFKKGGAGYKTNNVGSLRKGMGLKNVIKTEHIDNSKTRPVYETMYDGLYEKTHLLASDKFMYKCNYTWNTALCYTAGCKANPKDVMASGITKGQNATNHMTNALLAAKKLGGTASNNGEIKVAKEKIVEIDLWKNAKKHEEKIEYRENQKRIAEENIEAHNKLLIEAWGKCIGTKWCRD